MVAVFVVDVADFAGIDVNACCCRRHLAKIANRNDGEIFVLSSPRYENDTPAAGSRYCRGGQIGDSFVPVRRGSPSVRQFPGRRYALAYGKDKNDSYRSSAPSAMLTSHIEI